MILSQEHWMNLRAFKALAEAGASWAEIARETGYDWRTVKRYLSTDASAAPPAPAKRGRGARKTDPKSDAGIRPVPLAPLVVAAIRRQLPPGSDPDALVFTGPGGGPGHPGGPGVPKGTRTVLSRHNFRRTHHAAVAKLSDPATSLRPTAARVLKVLRARGPLTPDQIGSYLAEHGRAARPATVHGALDELHAAGLATTAGDTHAGRWSALPPPQDPLFEAVDLHGAHDFRHSFATWLEDAGIPARVIDAVMGHEASGRTRQQRGSAMGAHYRHTTPEMAARVAAAVQERLTVVLQVAEGP